MTVLTYAYTGALPERHMCVAWSSLLVFLCKTFWIKFLRLRKVLRVILDNQQRDVNADTSR
jgi:hypothetical protein